MFDRLHALIVDDQDLMRSVTASQLRAMGFAKVLSAKNGADALKLMRAQRIDAVLSDWNMPVMNGVELLRACLLYTSRYVDMALYRAKEAGRGTYAVYAPAMAHQLSENLKLRERLKHAMDHNLLALHLSLIHI